MEIHAREQGTRFWTHIRSPLTLRSVVFVLALFFFGYAVFSELSARRRQEDRRNQIDRLSSDSQQSLENTRAILIGIDERREQSQVLLEYMRQMNADLRTISEVLRAERVEREKGKAVKRTVRPKPSVRHRALKTCLRETQKIIPFGEQNVVEKVLVPVPCRD
jgi:hypothetical protein